MRTNINSTELTRREIQLQDFEKEMFDKQANHALDMKKLELEVAKIEARWSSWLKIPITIVKLPVYILLGIGFCISVAKNKELSDRFWNYLK